MGLVFICRKQKESNWRGIIKLVKERRNDVERQNMVAKISEKSSLPFIKTGTLVGVENPINKAQITDFK
jgi:hypothetical protein